eukprot:CAMPEP_0119267322 /NCGR_PEP_ID=MMETSP1329-20130426/5517_1 /TAXON_ID=114041 /ORGANISM="Genus nov. species nov., Strain RCC1024" /LENGTH=210 /DNA_ID=CAMNT_0007267243 /DNA_START=92 /DNA_END=720 /DNA_ORIENTATION=+
MSMDAPPSSTLLLTPLEEGTEEGDIMQFFDTVGAQGLVSSRLRKDRTGAHIAFAEFASVEAASRARELAGASSAPIGRTEKYFAHFARGGGAKRPRDDAGHTGPPPARPRPPLPGAEVATHTLFVSGWPPDCGPREASHIFRPFPGFRGLRMRPQREPSAGKGPLAFVDFDMPNEASVARRAVDGYPLNYAPSGEAVGPRLRVEFAKTPS